MVLITAQEHKDEVGIGRSDMALVMTRLKDMDEEAHIIGELLPRKDGQGQMHIAGEGWMARPGMDELLTLLHGAYHAEACLLELQPHFSHLSSDSSGMEDVLRILPGLCSRAPADAFRELSSQAESCTEAEVLLASVLYRRKISKGLVSDEAAAAGVFRHATATARRSHLGLALLGCAYLDGLGVQAAEQGNAAAKCSLSYCCEKGVCLKQDHGRAKELLQESASQGYAHALFKLGCWYQYGILGTEIQLQEAHRLYVEASRQGHPAGMAQLGRSFADGAGVPEDKAEACRWLRLAADAGNPDAMYCLALAYRHGDGVEVDLSTATELYRQSGDLGHPQALYNLGCCYMNGTGVPRDPQAAVECYRLAADKGDMDAHVNLAKCLLTGEGVTTDQAEAQRLLMVAADHGHPAGWGRELLADAVPLASSSGEIIACHLCNGKGNWEDYEGICHRNLLASVPPPFSPALVQSNGHAFAPPPRGAESYVETLLEKAGRGPSMV
ncbi:esiB [Symbiodinium sp. CCMP2592]|nr:esiB [Symbiodinium sp. CCMP2592]